MCQRVILSAALTWVIGCGGRAEITTEIQPSAADASSVDAGAPGDASDSVTDLSGGHDGSPVLPEVGGDLDGPSDLDGSTDPPSDAAPDPLSPFCSIDGWCWSAPLPQGNLLEGVWGAAPGDVWAVGSGGTILHWDGTHWLGAESPTTVDLHDIIARASPATERGPAPEPPPGLIAPRTRDQLRWTGTV